MKQDCWKYDDYKTRDNVCVYYGDCPYIVYDCPEDEPWAKCKHRSTPNDKAVRQATATTKGQDND